MINRSTLGLCIAVAVLCSASIALSQTREVFDPELPMVFDGQGGYHYCLYGYYRPFDPSISKASDYTTLVCPRELPPGQWLQGA
jgi:hypothetical protein